MEHESVESLHRWLREREDEVKKLTGELRRVTVDRQAGAKRIDELLADNQRLRSEALSRGNALGRIAIALFGDHNNRSDEECVAAAAEVGYSLAGCRERCARLEAEIERLQNANQDLVDERDIFARTLNKRDAEIERLRKERDDVLAAKEIVFQPPAIPEGFVIQELQKANLALHADIARLRSSARCPHCDELRLELGALRNHFDIIQSAANGKDAEIERLRGETLVQSECIETLRALLRETLPYFGRREVAPGNWVPHPLGTRIREALGDVPDA